jgi:hypothetical protein
LLSAKAVTGILSLPKAEIEDYKSNSGYEDMMIAKTLESYCARENAIIRIEDWSGPGIKKYMFFPFLVFLKKSEQLLAYKPSRLERAYLLLGGVKRRLIAIAAWLRRSG